MSGSHVNTNDIDIVTMIHTYVLLSLNRVFFLSACPCNFLEFKTETSTDEIVAILVLVLAVEAARKHVNTILNWIAPQCTIQLN